MMSFETLRRAIAAARPIDLPSHTGALWRAFGDGAVSEAEATELSALIEARATGVPCPSPSPVPRMSRTGSRPRTNASLSRRREWAASGYVPRALAAHFTTAEHAALAVVASEIIKRARCELSLGQIAAMAGISISTTKNALRLARALGLLTIRERRISRNRNLTNVVEIIDRMWSTWLQHRGARRLGSACGQGGGKSVPRTSTVVLEAHSKGERTRLKSAKGQKPSQAVLSRSADR